MLLLKLLEFLRCDGNENGKKAIGLYQQNNNFARDHAFFVQGG